ncbi:hypothetical protein SMALA_8195 [Streptomyces malaysiensis subsp. malaysiensis]|nr:hypothetical protein SMALA_8195 [Streptomyces malaysiensis]
MAYRTILERCTKGVELGGEGVV